MDFESDIVSFVACGIGVTPTYSGTSFNEQLRDWQRMHVWCDDQGLESGKDYFSPGEIPNGRWYFREAHHQLLFTLRWS